MEELLFTQVYYCCNFTIPITRVVCHQESGDTIRITVQGLLYNILRFIAIARKAIDCDISSRRSNKKNS